MHKLQCETVVKCSSLALHGAAALLHSGRTETIMNITLGTTIVPFTFWTPAHGTVFNTIFGLDTETTLIDDNHPWITPAYVLGAACDGTTGYLITRQHIAA